MYILCLVVLLLNVIDPLFTAIVPAPTRRRHVVAVELRRDDGNNIASDSKGYTG